MRCSRAGVRSTIGRVRSGATGLDEGHDVMIVMLVEGHEMMIVMLVEGHEMMIVMLEEGHEMTIVTAIRSRDTDGEGARAIVCLVLAGSGGAIRITGEIAIGAGIRMAVDLQDVNYNNKNSLC